MYLNYDKSCFNKVFSIQPNTSYRSSTTVFYYALQHVSAIQTIALDLYVVFGQIKGHLMRNTQWDNVIPQKNCVSITMHEKSAFQFIFLKVPILVM